MQVDPPLGANAQGLLDLATALTASGLVHFVDVNERVGRAGMSSLMVAAAIERECGIESIPHLTTRDWTVNGLESMLLGAHAAGVRDVLAITGDPPEVGDYPGSSGVYDIDAIGLTRLLADGLYARGLFTRQACLAPWLHTFFAWNGDAYLCCMTNGWMDALGNVGRQSVREIFHGAAYQEVRRRFQAGHHLASCHRCDLFLRENARLHTALDQAGEGGGAVGDAHGPGSAVGE